MAFGQIAETVDGADGPLIRLMHYTVDFGELWFGQSTYRYQPGADPIQRQVAGSRVEGVDVAKAWPVDIENERLVAGTIAADEWIIGPRPPGRYGW